jgi:hypothetical protein
MTGEYIEIQGSERTVKEQAHENEEMIWKDTVIQREQMNGVELHCCLLSQIGAFLGYSLLQVTSIHHHHSLFDHCNCVAFQQLWVRYLQIVSPCPEQVDRMWTSVGGRDSGDRRRWSSQNNTGSNVDGV